MTAKAKDAHEGVLSTIGNTPLVRLVRVFEGAPFRLYAKLEGFNPGGSMKDRPALTIISKAMERGDIRPGGCVIESSSGNMGIGLAQACAYWGLRFICVVDPKTTRQNISILEAYGAEVDMVMSPDPATGEYLPARINRVRQLLSEMPGAYWPDQYSNIYNPVAHHQTMDEIVTELHGRVDILFCSTSTCGTLRGCAEYIRGHRLHTRVFAVDAQGSVIFGDNPAKRLIPGHGAARRPELYQPGLADEYILVSDLDCVVGCRRLLKSEAIMAGGSSGAVISAVEKVKNKIPEGATCVIIMADRGERYLDTIYSNSWVGEHFGDVARLWSGANTETAHIAQSTASVLRPPGRQSIGR